ncbi:hypothetical protein [Corynebacterium liangguodongii]|uniref:Uncharacterized protein n=1 Tax=Corynebacterium liangguodongii TaxID=2079535 RepID=A0A2S0WFZ2_9CORY|nr:hypothetical protein [Corynebacterium liangguodongii]AWB84644.1 hypothetical protein C3E79_09310 [Corynebacterium liangguodongii]PWB99652.1 hypothetical protein DF219_05090 [Corynebacterium liangguodongii]
MEVIEVKSLKPGAAGVAVAASAVLLASCSAGQITQTSSQVAAVDGASTESESGAVAVHDVTVVLSEDGQAALKFTAVNQDSSMKPHRLLTAAVDGVSVELTPAPREIASKCTVVGDSAAGIKALPQAEGDCIQYVATSVANKGFAYGGNVPVTFTFDSGKVETDAAISAPTLASGESDRGPAEGGSAHAGHSH